MPDHKYKYLPARSGIDLQLAKRFTDRGGRRAPLPTRRLLREHGDLLWCETQSLDQRLLQTVLPEVEEGGIALLAADAGNDQRVFAAIRRQRRLLGRGQSIQPTDEQKKG